MKKNKSETKKLQDTPTKKSQTDYSQLLPLLSASLEEIHSELSAYVLVPAKGHGFAFAVVYGKAEMPYLGVFDISLNTKGELAPGSFDAFVTRGPRTYSQALGFFERFAIDTIPEKDIMELFGK